LAPAPNHSDASWMTKRSFLAGLGYGFLVVYVGRQTTNLTYAQGQTDGDDAVNKAIQAGFESAVIYLDVESGPPLSQDLLTYIGGWLDMVGSFAAWHPGVYCSYLTANQIKTSRPNMSIRFWVWRLSNPSPGCTTEVGSLDPTDSGVAYASSWQYAQNCTNQTWNNQTISPIDLDMSTTQNPSAS